VREKKRGRSSFSDKRELNICVPFSSPPFLRAPRDRQWPHVDATHRTTRQSGAQDVPRLEGGQGKPEGRDQAEDGARKAAAKGSASAGAPANFLRQNAEPPQQRGKFSDRGGHEEGAGGRLCRRLPSGWSARQSLVYLSGFFSKSYTDGPFSAPTLAGPPGEGRGG
jgi:hypothetical protein